MSEFLQLLSEAPQGNGNSDKGEERGTEPLNEIFHIYGYFQVWDRYVFLSISTMLSLVTTFILTTFFGKLILSSSWRELTIDKVYICPEDRN